MAQELNIIGWNFNFSFFCGGDMAEFDLVIIQPCGVFLVFATSLFCAVLSKKERSQHLFPGLSSLFCM
jgi:hypothetical protein